MNRNLLDRSRPFYRRLIEIFPKDEEAFKTFKIIALGCMFGTAMASPFLFEEFRNIWFLDVCVFFASSGAFMWQNQQEIKTYGPFTLVAATFFGLAAYSSARTPLKELVPWLPTAVCLFLLLTVYFFPKLRQAFSGYHINRPDFSMEEGRSIQFAHSNGSSVEPGSVQSDESIRSQRQRPEVDHWIDFLHETSHIGGVGRPSSRQSGLSFHGSDIDLESHARLAANRSCHTIGNLPRIASHTGFPSQRFAAAGPSNHGNPHSDYHPRSLSPESVVEGPSATSESERPLLDR